MNFIKLLFLWQRGSDSRSFLSYDLFSVSRPAAWPNSHMPLWAFIDNTSFVIVILHWKQGWLCDKIHSSISYKEELR